MPKKWQSQRRLEDTECPIRVPVELQPLIQISLLVMHRLRARKPLLRIDAVYKWIRFETAIYKLAINQCLSKTSLPGNKPSWRNKFCPGLAKKQ
ncbi:hypothetical protein CEXT_76931 [Caerostris extrusa]|uniref:Uncharacterized protein n=1 Tax=Caerostris extrusa TaxID=172846 RepID=A0AAV4MCR5_CAEEX|nr:hypothetical protein CEXT_76931 [Caerostris extrusa]